MAAPKTPRRARGRAQGVLDEAEGGGLEGQGGADPRQAEAAGSGGDNPEDAQKDVTVGVEQELPQRPRGSRSTRYRCARCGQYGHNISKCPVEGIDGLAATSSGKKPSAQAVGSIAPMLVGTLNFCVVTSFGPACGLTDLEGKLLIPSVQRTLERMPAEAATKAAIVLDPLIMLTVLVMWAKRISAIKANEAREKYSVTPAEQARANGMAGFTYVVPQPGTPGVPGAPPPAGEPGPTPPAEPEPPTSNGVPQAIRDAFNDRI